MFEWFKRKKKRRQGRKRGREAETNVFDWFHAMVIGSALAPDDSASSDQPHHGHHDASAPTHDHSAADPGPSFDPGTSDTSGGFDGGSSGGFDGGSSGGGAGADW